MMLPRVKVCGLTRLEDAQWAAQLGAWALGFIQYPKSPRAMPPEKIREILKHIRQPVQSVAVFVNEEVDRLKKFVLSSGVNAVQLHGEESQEYCRQIKSEFPSMFLIKSFRLHGLAHEDDLPKAYTHCDAFLLERGVEGAYGGTGVQADWQQAQRMVKKFKTPLILAGGLRPENVSSAIQEVGPWAVDVSSGLEDFPGIKNPIQMNAFFKQVRMER